MKEAKENVASSKKCTSFSLGWSAASPCRVSWKFERGESTRTPARATCLFVSLIAVNSIGLPSALATPNSSEELPLYGSSGQSQQEMNAKAQQLVDGGNAAYKAHDYATAIALYTELITIKPGDPRAYYTRGNAYYKVNDLERALADFCEVLKIDSGFHLALMNRGNIYSRFGKYSEAIADYDRAVKQKPGDSLIWYNRGVAYGRISNDAHAMQDLEEAIRLNPRDAQSYAERGLILLRQGKPSEARLDFEVALKLNPENARAASGLIQLEELKRSEDAPVAMDTTASSTRWLTNGWSVGLSTWSTKHVSRTETTPKS